MQAKDLKRAGLKVTVPRMKILEIMERSDSRHCTAEDIYRKLMQQGEAIGLATIYRVLTQFEAVGMVNRLHFEKGSACYEINRGDHHDHMICTECGRITEFVDEIIEQRQEAIAHAHGFSIGDHSLVLHVECQDKNCQHRNASPHND